ncbi:MAG: hypothetical protein ACI9PC_000014 [Porticoccaceae bacterium]|jgi:hypothetical protein
MTQIAYEELFFVVAILALLDSLTPSSIRDVAYLLKRNRPFSIVTFISFGRTAAAYILCAPLIYFISAYMAEHELLHSLLSFLVGFILIRLGVVLWKSPVDNSIPSFPDSGGRRLVQFSFKEKLKSLPLAIPYVLAIDEIRVAGLPLLQIGAFILLYLLFYHFPANILGIIRLVSHKKNEFIFRTLESSAGALERYYGTVALVAIGFFLIISSMAFLTILLFGLS